jgi:cysteine desulfurase/selenocysteine lyase
MGTVTPLGKMIEAAHLHGAKVVVDASQSVPHMAVDVQALNTDFFAFSGHKMLGLMGIGVLAAREDLLEEMDPVFYGGEMISDVDYLHSSWNDLPWKFEAGTQNIGGAISLGAAVDYLQDIGFDAIGAHDALLTRYALEQLSHIEGLRIFGPTEGRAPVISFNLNGVHAHDLATFLDSADIAIRAGHHCAKLIMRRLRVPATARASFYLYNTIEEIDRLVIALDEAKRKFK